MDGWIKLHRKLSDNPIWTSEPFTDGQALVDLILLANHKQGQIKVRGIRIIIDRGQVGWSELKLSKRWRWSRGKVRRFLRFLEAEKMIKIVQQNNNVTTIVTILNYSRYQESSTTSGTTNGQQTDTNKNVKNVKNVKNIYKDELKNTDDKYYHAFFEFLIGNGQDIIMERSISLEKPLITYKQFKELQRIAKEKNKKIRDTVLEFENYGKGSYKSLYLTIRKWLQR